MAVLLPQSPAVVVAHLAIYKLGAVALPLAVVFGPEGLRHRLGDAGAKGLVTQSAGLAKVAPLRDDLPDLSVVISTEGNREGPRAGRRCIGVRCWSAPPTPSRRSTRWPTTRR